jgi:hypothetical protein
MSECKPIQIAAISSRLDVKKSEVSIAIPVFSEEKLHSVSESNNHLTMAAEGSSETSYHIGLSRTVVPKFRSVREFPLFPKIQLTIDFTCI